MKIIDFLLLSLTISVCLVGQFFSKTKRLKKGSSESVFLTSKRKPNLIGTDRGKYFVNNIFQNSSNKNNIEHYSRNSSLGSLFSECFNRTIRDLLK